MEKRIKGKVFILGDNIDTDQIIPAEHLVYSLSDEEESKNYGKFALSGVPPEKSGLPKGDIPYVNNGYQTEYPIIIGGKNFGCGSSREHAPFALQVAGTKVIVAESYARIFYRNSVDGGFVVPYETEQRLVDTFATGDECLVDFEENTIKNIPKNKEFKLRPLGSILPIIEAGDIFAYARLNNMLS